MKIIRSRNFYIIFALDVLLVMLSFYMAHLFRFDFDIPGWARQEFLKMLPYIIVIKTACFFFFDLYRGMWRYTGLSDLINVGKASITSTLLGITFVLYFYRFENISRSVFIIDWCLTFIFIIGLRVLTRMFFERIDGPDTVFSLFQAFYSILVNRKPNGIRIIILGAGYCGEKICRELKSNPSLNYNLIGFLDDDPEKIGRKIHGVPIVDDLDNIQAFVQGHGVEEAIIAISSVSSDRMKSIVNQCKNAGLKFKTVPDMGELINGKISISSIRDVEYRDLLGRQPVELDKEKIGRYLGEKTIIVTGAGGSIGKGLCRQICRYNPEKLILFERAESPLYDIDLELKKAFPSIEIIPILGDIQKKEDLEKVFGRYHPQIVFHAAAYKHVPMLEAFPWKAVENNIFGTKNLVTISKKFECEKFVFVSTDKAVNPTNVMGASKRVAENIVQCITGEESRTRFITVRFGNVIGSAGSVIPLFKKQIKEGGPVTVTHPEVIRFFMLIPEACQLILQAGAMGKGREIFVLEMGKPIKIDAMARDLIRFSGFEPDKDIKIEYTGLRPGEKLYEELMAADEHVVPTQHKQIMVLNSDQCTMLNLDKNLAQLRNGLINGRNKELLIDILKKMVPEFNWKN